MDTRISVLISGSGTNLQALIDAGKEGRLGPGRIVQVISSKAGAGGLKRAMDEGIPAIVIDGNHYPREEERNDAILSALQAAATDMVVLAGYIRILPPKVIHAYRGRIVNIHPALIPSHSGKGMYGIRVHQSVLKSKDTESGATVHLVDEGVDTGVILAQDRVPVLTGDTPETLGTRVLQVEHRILPAAVADLAEKIQRVKEEKTNR